MANEKTHKALTFGVREVGKIYVERPSVYAVIRNTKREIATVKPKTHYFLPGGGIDPGETAKQALARELMEELAWHIAIGAKLGEARQYFSMPHKSFKMFGHFYEAKLISESDSISEYEPLWLPSEAIANNFYHACHEWAVKKACGLL